MSPQPYVDIEPNGNVQAHCAICGDSTVVTLRLAWYRGDELPKAIPRCLDVEACRARVAEWPLLERGESPHNLGWTPAADRPMQAPETTQPDGQETERDRWI